MGTYKKKYLEDGSINPEWQPRKREWKKQPSGKKKYQRKFLEDGSLNPKFKTRKRPSRPKPYQPKELPDGTLNPKYRKQFSLFYDGQFIAIDGEGSNTEDGRHVYDLLAGGQMNISKNGGLSTKACFDFLLYLRDKKPKSIFVIFGGSYDANMWLADLDKETILQINNADGKYFVDWEEYQIRYVPRKYFSLKRRDDKKPVVIWDVHGFFQSSFISALKNWLPDYKDLDLIVEGKSKRSQFDTETLDFKIRYCYAELEALELMMDKLREGVTSLDLTLSRWDGAGAVAASILKKHSTKKAIADLPDNVRDAVEHAYFGGRIEIGKYGHHKKKVYHYDINSAYPSVQRHLPALAGGRWVYYEHGVDPRRHNFLLTVSLVQWYGIEDTAFCPFPYRSKLQNKVLFPSHGLNWIWRPELEAALDVKEEQQRLKWNIDILQTYIFVPDDKKDLPFAWINDYYDERQKIVAESKRTGVPNGQEKVIKLGINSLYGKTAQKVGYNETTGAKPPYHSLAYAGHITSATRAELWKAAMQADDKIIALATDGIYSQVPLKLDCPKEKVLGKWEAQKHDEMILVQAGFYFYKEGDRWTSYSRGFDKLADPVDIVRTKNKIIEAWENKQMDLLLPCTRFITYKTALRGEWWDKWRTWHESVTEDGAKGRRLSLSPEGTKREPSGNGRRPDIKMLPTKPAYNFSSLNDMSEKYSLPWDSDDITDTMIDIEHTDSYT